MNQLGLPPSKDPLVTAVINMQTKSVVVVNQSTWIQWISDLYQSLNSSGLSGTTAQRPDPPPAAGYQFFDTTLDRPIWVNSALIWVDADGAPV